MTCLEHLIENQLARFEEHPEKTYEQYIDDIKSDINFEDAGITAEQCYEITQYVLYSYCSNCSSKHQDKRNNGKLIFKDYEPIPIKISRLKQQILGFRSVIRHLYDALYWARKSGLLGEDIRVMVDLIDKLDAQEFDAQKALDELEEKEKTDDTI